VHRAYRSSSMIEASFNTRELCKRCTSIMDVVSSSKDEDSLPNNVRDAINIRVGQGVRYRHRFVGSLLDYLGS
jgi:hypothetical protein